jgi:hypothetical protein
MSGVALFVSALARPRLRALRGFGLQKSNRAQKGLTGLRFERIY